MNVAWPARLVVAALFAVLFGCMHPRAIHAPEGVRLTPLKTISSFEARVLLALSGVEGHLGQQRGGLLSDAVFRGRCRRQGRSA